MRLVHLSDLHLGFRAFPRRERGWNLRERDLATTFHRTIQEVARHRPAVVLISGDIFDHPDPPSTAFLTLSRGLATLRGLLPEVTVLAIAGERDTPFTLADPGPVAVVDALPGVEAAAGAPRAVHLRQQELHALLVPQRAILKPPFPELRPDPDARWNVLLLRGTPLSEGSTDAGRLENGNPPIGLPRVQLEGWDYVALGGPHGHRRWGGRVWNAGSLDRVGGDPWREATEEKGFVLFDLTSGTGEFHPVPGRPVVDLAPVRVDPRTPEVGGRRLREVLDGVPGGIEGKIVRLRLQGSVDTPLAALPPGLLRAVERRASHLEVRVEPEDLDARAVRRRPDAPPTLGMIESPERHGSDPDLTPSGVYSGEVFRIRWRGGGEGELAVGPGLWALVADAAEDRGRMVEALTEGEGDGPPVPEGSGLAPLLRLEPPGKVRHLDDEAGLPALLGRLEREAWTVADGCRTGLPGAVADSDGRDEVEAGEGDAIGRDRKLRTLIREARADWVEAAGDLEARIMEWTRERQEAETRLITYRGQARELRERLRALEAEGTDAPCPTCARPLAGAHPDLVGLLREEWESVVQDGQWWKRRREQLEDRPDDLRELERQALRLHARVESLSEGVAAREEGEGPTAGGGTPPADGGEAEIPAGWRLSPRSQEARDLLRIVGEYLRRITEGELQGVASDVAPVGGEFRILRGVGEASYPTPEETSILRAALILTWLQQPGSVRRHRLGLMSALSGADGDPWAVRTLEILAAECPSRPILVVISPSLLTRCPELFQGTLELRRDDDGRLRFRTSPGGVAWVHLPTPVGDGAVG